MPELLLKDEVFAVVGAAFEVYNELGSGYPEPVYQSAMEIELGDRGIPFDAQRRFPVVYKGRDLGKEYIPDFLCFGTLIVEWKVLDELTGKEDAQVLEYLKATGLQVGLLLNFGSHPKLEWKRLVL